MKVKICGITNIEDAQLACELGADAVGFIFYEKSKRFVENQKVKSIISMLPSSVEKVGVFVNEPPENINRISKEISLTVAQLHGNESPDFLTEINLPIWKALRVKEDFDFTLTNNFMNCKIMLDAYSQNEFGGTGKTFNWNIIPDSLKSEIILAGGISSFNIEEIYKNIKPAWVDISSSLEIQPGKKDKIKLEDFFNKVNILRK